MFKKIKSWFSPADPKQTAREKLQAELDAVAQQILSGYRARQVFDGEKLSGGMNYDTAWGLDIYRMRERSTRAYWESMQARGIINRFVDTVINTGLMLESTPVSSILGLSQEQRKETSNKIEDGFNLWSNSKDCDLARESTLGQMERILYRNQLVKGDYFAALIFSKKRTLINPLQIKIIKTELVSTPFDSKIKSQIENKGHYIVDGIEFDKNDKEIAIYVKTKNKDNVNYKWVRYPKYGPVSGRQILVHGKVEEFGNEPRGIPILAHVAHELEKITDYSLLELMAAVANATIAAVVKPADNAPATNPFPGNSFIPPSLAQTPDELTAIESTTDHGYTNVGKNVLSNAGGLLVSSLNAGEEFVSHDTKRPNVNHEAFVDSVSKYLSSALSMPIEVLNMVFGNNFSSSRATLKLFWQSVFVKRDDFISDFKTPVFQAWLLGEVGTGNLILKGFEDPKLRAAWQSAEWIGVPSPSIDPLKEEKAAKLRIAEGLRTHEQEAQRRHGTSFDSNVDRLASENQRLADANAPIFEQRKGSE